MLPKYLLWKLILLLVISGAMTLNSSAHHVLGRPAYSLNEDSNMPSSMQVETQIGDYSVFYMVSPAFPRAGENGRINLYASKLDSGESFGGKVQFKVRDDSWFATNEELLGSQQATDFVFRQNFVFSQDGDYIITAEFEANGEPYVIDFPLRVGELTGIGPLGIAVGIILVSLVGVSLLQRRKKPGPREPKATEKEIL
jgi:hypothetical protein